MDTDSLKIGITHPGEMGSSVGAVLVEEGHDVMWASEGRSEETTQRAVDAGLRDVESFTQMAKEADVIFSICFGSGSLEVFEKAVKEGFTGIFVDANFVSDGFVSKFLQMGADADFPFVDGAIYGYPLPGPDGFTSERSFYLHGDNAQLIADLFEGTPFDGIVLDESAKVFRARRMAGESPDPPDTDQDTDAAESD
jgi:prephenate dehydrogenase